MERVFSRRRVRVVEVVNVALFKAVEVRDPWNKECSQEAARFGSFENAMAEFYMGDHGRDFVAHQFDVGEVVVCRDNSNRFYRVLVTAIGITLKPDECRGEAVDYGSEVFFLSERVYRLAERFSRSRMQFQVKKYRLDGIVPASTGLESGARQPTRASKMYAEEAKRQVQQIMSAESGLVTIEFDSSCQSQPIPVMVYITQREAAVAAGYEVRSHVLCLNEHLISIRLAYPAQLATSDTSPTRFVMVPRHASAVVGNVVDRDVVDRSVALAIREALHSSRPSFEGPRVSVRCVPRVDNTVWDKPGTGFQVFQHSERSGRDNHFRRDEARRTDAGPSQSHSQSQSQSQSALGLDNNVLKLIEESQRTKSSVGPLLLGYESHQRESPRPFAFRSRKRSDNSSILNKNVNQSDEADKTRRDTSGRVARRRTTGINSRKLRSDRPSIPDRNSKSSKEEFTRIVDEVTDKRTSRMIDAWYARADIYRRGKLFC